MILSGSASKTRMLAGWEMSIETVFREVDPQLHSCPMKRQKTCSSVLSQDSFGAMERPVLQKNPET